MHRRGSYDTLSFIMAIAGDAVAVYTGLMLAVWIRFFSGWIPLTRPLPPLDLYWQGAAVATLVFLLVFASIGMYKRPQSGSFSDQIPRIIRGVLWSIGLAMILAFAIRTDPPFSRLATGLSLFTVAGLVTIERYALFQLGNLLARRRGRRDQVVILGTGNNAARLGDALEGNPRFRSQVSAFLTIGDEQPDPDIAPGRIRGTVDELQAHLDAGTVNRVILSHMAIGHAEVVELIVKCERAMVEFLIVPDLFRIMTSRVDIQHIDGVPLLGIGGWPLDRLGNRLLKRTEDIVGSLVGLLLSAPLIAVFALLVKRSSPGPALYRQERCGENGRPFTIYKLRTMVADAEARSGPVWAREGDPRRTPLGTFMRRYSIDELPQFWNVLRGDMSLVGPRPERPHFVERFREDIGSYMWRHTYRPGMTGWAQVNGLRGDTGLEERIKHDLFYLENWSLAFDFKILVRTAFARENAY